jgi:hypothetical protein
MQFSENKFGDRSFNDHLQIDIVAARQALQRFVHLGLQIEFLDLNSWLAHARVPSRYVEKVLIYVASRDLSVSWGMRASRLRRSDSAGARLRKRKRVAAQNVAATTDRVDRQGHSVIAMVVSVGRVTAVRAVMRPRPQQQTLSNSFPDGAVRRSGGGSRERGAPQTKISGAGPVVNVGTAMNAVEVGVSLEAHQAVFRKNCQSASGSRDSHVTAPSDSRSMSIANFEPTLWPHEIAFLR